MPLVLQTFLTALGDAWQGLERGLLGLGWGALEWTTLGLALLALVLLSLLLRSRSHTPRTPQLLISRGEISQAENSSMQLLLVKVSNLNDYPVQLLELALRSERMPQAMTLEAVELLGPHQAVELEAELPNDIVGDRGVIYAYLHSPRQRGAIYRLQGNFAWEPWNKRYKVSPVGQSVRPARSLTSAQLDVLRKQAWIERNPHLGRGPTSAAAKDAAGNSGGPSTRATGERTPQDAKSEAEARKGKLEWEFPQDF